MAASLHDRGDYEGAEPLYREALQITRNLLGRDHPGVALGMHNLAFLLYNKGNTLQAEKLFRDSLAMTIEVLGESHPVTADLSADLAMVLVAQGLHEEAGELFERALEIDPKIFPPGVGGPWRAQNRSAYGECLVIQGRYQDAQAHLLGALDILKQHLGENDERTQQTLNRLVKLYEAWEKPDKAAEYRGLMAAPGDVAR